MTTENYTLEICKMLTLSTAHITQETSEYIRREDVASFSSEYGFIIYTTPYEEVENPNTYYPADLRALVEFAKAQGCDYLRLDRDGKTLAQFPTYDW